MVLSALSGENTFGSVIVAIGYRRFTFKVLSESAMQTLSITTMIMFVSLGATMFSGVFMGLGGGKYIGSLVVALPFGKWGILAVIMLVIIILGMFIDWIGILFIVIPIFTPIAMKMGFNPIWFATVVCVNLQMSFLTPPFAYSMFYLKGIAPPSVTMADIYRGVIPFVGLQVLALFIVIAFPWLSLWLPSLM